MDRSFLLLFFKKEGLPSLPPASYSPPMIDLAPYRTDNHVHLISPPQSFEGGEEQYDLAIGGQDALHSGHGAWQLAARHATRPIESLLEVGAGGGTCSLGLVDAAGTAELLITDTSPAFLQIIRRKLAAQGVDPARTRFATLAGEDLGRLPPASLDAVVIASALHHVTDWRAFLADAAAVLRPGGVLVIQEPCREGNLMMGLALDVVLSPLWPAAAALSHEDHDRIDRCRDSIYFLANSHIAKVGEDKHSFLVSELATAASTVGFTGSVFYANAHFADLADTDLSLRHGACSIVGYMDSFLEMHHRVSLDGMEKLRTHLFPVLAKLDRAFVDGDGAPLFGCMVFCR